MNHDAEPLKAFWVTLITDDGWRTVPAIEVEGALWVSPAWLVSPDKRSFKLERLVRRLDNLKHEPAPGSGGSMRVVTDPIPKSVLDGQSTPGFEVRVAPDFVVQAPDEAPAIH